MLNRSWCGQPTAIQRDTPWIGVNSPTNVRGRLGDLGPARQLLSHFSSEGRQDLRQWQITETLGEFRYDVNYLVHLPAWRGQYSATVQRKRWGLIGIQVSHHHRQLPIACRSEKTGIAERDPAA